jgi:hypothetical protein
MMYQVVQLHKTTQLCSERSILARNESTDSLHAIQIWLSNN